jgi:hypothetical protein
MKFLLFLLLIPMCSLAQNKYPLFEAINYYPKQNNFELNQKAFANLYPIGTNKQDVFMYLFINDNDAGSYIYLNIFDAKKNKSKTLLKIDPDNYDDKYKHLIDTNSKTYFGLKENLVDSFAKKYQIISQAPIVDTTLKNNYNTKIIYTKSKYELTRKARLIIKNKSNKLLLNTLKDFVDLNEVGVGFNCVIKINQKPVIIYWIERRGWEGLPTEIEFNLCNGF